MRGRDQDEAGPGLSHTKCSCTHMYTGYTVCTVYGLYRYIPGHRYMRQIVKLALIWKKKLVGTLLNKNIFAH